MIRRFFKRKSDNESEGDSAVVSSIPPILLEGLDDNDYLGRAAQAKHLAKSSVKAKDFDSAWSLYHEQKTNYLKHAGREKFSVDQTLALDSTVHEQMANVLRIEGKHNDALVSIVYWVTALSQRPAKKHKDKFKAYFNRCKFLNTDLETAENEMYGISKPYEFTKARSLVREWISRE